MEAAAAAATVASLADVSAKIATLCFQYSVAVKNAKEDIDRLQMTVIDIQNVLRELEQLLNRHDETQLWTSHKLSDSLKECRQQLDGLKEQLGTSKSRKAMHSFGLRALKWPFTSEQVEQMVASLKQYEQTFSLALQVDNTDLILGIDRQLRLVDKKADHLLSKINEVKLPVAKGASFDSHTEEHNARCLLNTREELLHQITQWAKDANGESMFWLNGMAGTGKSTIARTAAQLFADQNRLGASFFFKKGEGERGNATKFFTTIATELMRKIPGLVSGVKKAVEADPSISDRAYNIQFEKLIFDPLSETAPLEGLGLIIVVDALDECARDEDIQAILGLLSQTKNLKPVSLRVFVTSRPELLIRFDFKNTLDRTYKDVILHDVPKQSVDHDLAVFVEYQLGKVREQRSLPTDWPSGDQIQALVDMATPLFIFADTACRYIGDKRDNPKKRLDIILQYPTRAQASKLDGTYLPILDQLFDDEGDPDMERRMSEFREVVGSIVTLESPLSVTSLAHLLSIPKEDIRCQLDPLHSVLSIPTSEDMPIRLLHLSFRDFLVDPQKQSKSPFWIDMRERHESLASKCIQIMSDPNGLMQNICGLPKPGISRSDVEEKKIAECLLPEVQYACCYWVHHLKQSGERLQDGGAVHVFLQRHFLHWLEALSLMGCISDSITSVGTLISILGEHESNELSSFLFDAKRFTLTNRPILDIAPLQIYSSALIFVPKLSVIRVQFQQYTPKWIARFPNIEAKWGAHIQTLEGHNSPVSSIAFSPDGKQLASASRDETVWLWDAATGQPLQTLKGHQSWVRSVAFSPDSKQLASAADDKAIRLWDTTTGQPLRTLEGHSQTVTSVAFSPDGEQLASASRDKTVRLWDIVTGQLLQTLSGHRREVKSVAFSPDGKQLASASGDKTICLHEIATGQLLQTLKGHGQAVTSVTFSPDGKQLASASDDKTVRLWDVATGQSRQILNGHNDLVRSVRFSPGGGLLASASDDWTIRLWDTVTWQPLQTLEGHGFKVSSIAFSPDGKQLVSSSADGTVRIWDTATAQPLHMDKDPKSFISSITFSPDGKQLVSASHDRKIRLWDPATGQSIQNFCGHKGAVDLVIFSPDGRQLASASRDKTIWLWDIATGQPLQTLRGHQHWVSSVAFSLDGKQLASASHDKTIRQWDVVTGQSLNTLKGHDETVTSVAFSPDGRLASASDDKTIRLWDIATGQALQIFEGHSQAVKLVAFSPDGKQLASASDDETIRLWDTATGQPLRTLEGHGSTTELSFTADNMSLVTKKRILHLDKPCNDSHSSLQHSPRPITLIRHWISINGENRIWLPNQHRGTCSVVSMNLLAIGQRSGYVHFWEFDLQSLDAD